MNDKPAIAYQFVLMLILAAFLALQYITTGEYNDILLGALIGSFSGVPIKALENVTKGDDTDDL